MDLNLGFLLISIIKIAALLGWLYGLLWGLGRDSLPAKCVTLVAAFGVIQLAISVAPGGVALFSDFDSGLLFQAATMAMVALGLNLIYGFNGQFSLGQWGFYGIGAYAAADITYRWTNNDASGLIVVAVGVILVGLVILGVQRFLNQYTGVPVMSAFTWFHSGLRACPPVTRKSSTTSPFSSITATMSRTAKPTDSSTARVISLRPWPRESPRKVPRA